MSSKALQPESASQAEQAVQQLSEEVLSEAGTEYEEARSASEAALAVEGEQGAGTGSPAEGSIESIEDDEEHAEALTDAMAATSLQEEQIPPPFAEDELKEREERAEALKAEGNVLFGEGNYAAARHKYDEATTLALDGSKLRAVCFGNMSACDLKEAQYDLAVQHATHAITNDPEFIKGFMRRAAAFEALADLDHALQDAHSVLKLSPGDAWAKGMVLRLEPIVKERHEKMKDELFGKLKEVGNSILGNFGMSLDNFKAVKDPNTGSYSVSFQQ